MSDVFSKKDLLCTVYLEKSFSRAAGIAKEALRSGIRVQKPISGEGLSTQEKLDTILNAYGMTEPGISGKELMN